MVNVVRGKRVTDQQARAHVAAGAVVCTAPRLRGGGCGMSVSMCACVCLYMRLCVYACEG
jgi:hypothetical protein